MLIGCLLADKCGGWDESAVSADKMGLGRFGDICDFPFFFFFFVRIRDVFLISCITISFFLRVKFSTLTFIGGEKEWFQSIVKKY